MSVKHTLLHCLSVLFYINNYAHKELIINIIYPRRTKTC
nr:MAG TPA: hypothetical protein [Bacteriophage sp.]